MNQRVSSFFAAVLTASVVMTGGYGSIGTANAAPPSSQVPSIGIGAGEPPPTHLNFGKSIPKEAKIVQVSAHLIVDKASPNGLNFFAIQVNFPNQTWAHGGPQLVKKDGMPFQQANWGGLVNRGGGSKDYKEADPKKDLQLIQSGVGQANTIPWSWEPNVEYILTVERGNQVHLPAAEIQNVQVGERTMWEWKFTIQPAVNDPSHPPFTALIYDSADFISSFFLWNESGYGSTKDEQHTRWSTPTFRTKNSTRDVVATKWDRF